MGSEVFARYEAAMERLRPEEREAVIARVELGLSHAEVAESLGKPSPAAAHMAVSRALVRLAEEMAHERSTRVEDPHVMAVAASISEGLPVDWAAFAAEPDATATAGPRRVARTRRRVEAERCRPGRLGEFAILGEIGHGAYGTVYPRRRRQPDLDVALKVIRPRPHSPSDPDRR